MQQPELVLHHPFSFQLPILLNVQSRQRPATRNKNRHSSALARHQHPTEKMSNSMKEKHLITSGLSRILPPRQCIFSRSQKKESQLDCQLFRPRRSSHLLDKLFISKLNFLFLSVMYCCSQQTITQRDGRSKNRKKPSYGNIELENQLKSYWWTQLTTWTTREWPKGRCSLRAVTS